MAHQRRTCNAKATSPRYQQLVLAVYRPPSSFTRASTDCTLLQPSVEAQTNNTNERFYCAVHFSAKHGLAIACRPSVCPSVTLVDCDHIGWNSSEIISPLVSLGCSLSADPNIMGLHVLQGEHPKFGPKVTHPCWFERRRHSIANCGRVVTDSATITMESL